MSRQSVRALYVCACVYKRLTEWGWDGEKTARVRCRLWGMKDAQWKTPVTERTEAPYSDTYHLATVPPTHPSRRPANQAAFCPIYVTGRGCGCPYAAVSGHRSSKTATVEYKIPPPPHTHSPALALSLFIPPSTAEPILLMDAATLWFIVVKRYASSKMH